MENKTEKPEKPELTPKEIRQIKRYCIMPTLAVPAGLGTFPMILLSFVLMLIDGLVLHAQSLFPNALVFMIVYGVITVICVGVYIYGFLGVRAGMKRKKWKKILSKLEVAQNAVTGDFEMSSAVGRANAARLLRNSSSGALSAMGAAAQLAATADVMGQVGHQTDVVEDNARAVAEAWGIKVPRKHKFTVLVLLLPSIILCLVSIPCFHATRQENKQISAWILSQMDQLEAALGGEEIRVIRDDPYKFKSGGYNITFQIKDDPMERKMVIEFRTNGKIRTAAWNSNEDAALSYEENLSDFLKYVNTTAEKILMTTVPLGQADRENCFDVPESVLEEYLQTPYDGEARASQIDDFTGRYLRHHIWGTEPDISGYISYRVEFK